MFLINITAAKNWYPTGNINPVIQLPASIDMSCLFCKIVTNVRLEIKMRDESLTTYSALGNCPRRNHPIRFWIIDSPIQNESPEQSRCAIRSISK